MCESDILAGPMTIIKSATASKINSNSTPPFPVMLSAPLTWKIAPSIIIEINDAVSLLKIPPIKKIPGINSANAIGICISTGSPIFGKKFANPASSFDNPCRMKIMPNVDLKPTKTISLSLLLLISLVVNF